MDAPPTTTSSPSSNIASTTYTLVSQSISYVRNYWTPTPSQPLRISSVDYTHISQLILPVQRAIDKNDLALAYCRARPLTHHLESLKLPACPIQYVAWMHPVTGSFQEMKYVRLFFFPSSLPTPQRLWPLHVPKEILAKDPCNDSLKDWLREVFTFCILPAPRDEAYGFKAKNWEQALNTIERIDLSTKGKPLAQQWLDELQKMEPTSEAFDNHLENLYTLLRTLAAHKICFFTEEEFVPFIETLLLNRTLLTQWRTMGFIGHES